MFHFFRVFSASKRYTVSSCCFKRIHCSLYEAVPLVSVTEEALIPAVSAVGWAVPRDFENSIEFETNSLLPPGLNKLVVLVATSTFRRLSEYENAGLKSK